MVDLQIFSKKLIGIYNFSINANCATLSLSYDTKVGDSLAKEWWLQMEPPLLKRDRTLCCRAVINFDGRHSKACCGEHQRSTSYHGPERPSGAHRRALE